MKNILEMLLKSLDILKGLWYNVIVEKQGRAVGGASTRPSCKMAVVGLRKVLPVRTVGVGLPID